MNTETIGLISGLIVVISIIPYAIRTYQGKIKPNPTSWLLWSMIGLALLLMYRSSGAEDNIWPTVFGFTNPTLIAILLIKNWAKWKKLESFEYVCFVIGIISLILWWQFHKNKELAQYALYLAILADACASIPTIVFVWRFPEKERPFAWGLFAIGYGLGILAISDYTFANYILPIYMSSGSFFITFILIKYRWKNKSPIGDWI